ncbi:four helix bundle protein [Balneolaceae bacterium YR4-1]|uniref:Four helix bundle protein n=1 Tax=Halalkalibaculum roseum TaxID=2709311 RepID=A0A6M1T1I9_9BACT|nr:four helix bundle protein [Halalkalibaculum roseum]NGP75915.1 four helix bundle protein [Halalkalibaculum roseum]
MKKENIIQKKSFDFSLSILEKYKKLIEEKEYVISKQLLKSGTSIGVNVEEPIAAQSRKDFISKMSIASKEARETKYWLRLLQKSSLTNMDLSDCLSGVDEIVRILTSIVMTTKRNS